MSKTIDVGSEKSYVEFAEFFICSLHRVWRNKIEFRDSPSLELSMKIEDYIYAKALSSNGMEKELWGVKEAIWWYCENCEKALRNLESWDRGWTREFNDKTGRSAAIALLGVYTASKAQKSKDNFSKRKSMSTDMEGITIKKKSTQSKAKQVNFASRAPPRIDSTNSLAESIATNNTDEPSPAPLLPPAALASSSSVDQLVGDGFDFNGGDDFDFMGGDDFDFEGDPGFFKVINKENGGVDGGVKASNLEQVKVNRKSEEVEEGEEEEEGDIGDGDEDGFIDVDELGEEEDEKAEDIEVSGNGEEGEMDEEMYDGEGSHWAESALEFDNGGGGEQSRNGDAPANEAEAYSFPEQEDEAEAIVVEIEQKQEDIQEEVWNMPSMDQDDSNEATTTISNDVIGEEQGSYENVDNVEEPTAMMIDEGEKLENDEDIGGDELDDKSAMYAFLNSM